MRTFQGRSLGSYGDLLDLVNQADEGIEALLDLLYAGGEAHLTAVSVYQLLKPLHEKLRRATNDLNDMKVRRIG